jgi:hypothetical protein
MMSLGNRLLRARHYLKGKLMSELQIVKQSNYYDESGTHVIEASLNRAPTDVEMQGLKAEGFNAFHWAVGETYPVAGVEEHVQAWSMGQIFLIWLYWLFLLGVIVGIVWLYINGFSCVIDIHCAEWLR